jgi:hypothetical protein
MLKRETAEHRAHALRRRFVEKSRSALPSARPVDPLERAMLVTHLRKPVMTDDPIDELARVIDAYLSGALSVADWRFWLTRMRGRASRGQNRQ